MKRFLLLALATTTLLGCDSDSGSDDTQTISSDVIVLSEDKYQAIEFELDRPTDIKVEARLIDGPSVEVYMVDQQDYNIWETAVAREQLISAVFRHYQELSIAPLASKYSSDWGKLRPGTYHLIIENTDYGNTAPNVNGINDKATIEYSLLAR